VTKRQSSDWQARRYGTEGGLRPKLVSCLQAFSISIHLTGKWSCSRLLNCNWVPLPVSVTWLAN